MKGLNYTIIIYIFCITLIYSCDDFFEKDISTEKVTLTTPVNGNSYTDSIIYFSWKEVKGATSYHIQVVTPSFANIQKLLFDSVTEKTTVNCEFTFGNYQWRVSALNTSYETNFSTDSFNITEPLLVEDILIELKTPENAEVKKNNNVEFEWIKNDESYKYNFIVKMNSWNDSTVYFESTFKNKITIALSDGTYYWGVAAVIENNEKEEVGEYNTRKLIINNNVPNYPTIISPTENDTVKSKIVQFNWEKVQDSCSYNFQLFKEEDLINPIIDKWIEGTSNTEVISANGQYLFKLRTKNKYNITGEYSPLYAFEVSAEIELSNSIITLIAPANNTTIQDTIVNFLWDEIKGNTSYNIQIVTPDFVNTEKMITNNWVTDNQFSITLSPGEYSWRVKARNDQSETNYTTNKFTIYSSKITSKIINVYTPENDALYNTKNIVFSWESLGNNCTYILELRKNEWSNNEVVKKIETTSTTTTISLGTGNYSFNTQAKDNINSEVSQSNIRDFEVDIEKPSVPIIQSPMNGYITDSSNIELTWTESSDDVESYVIEIYELNNSLYTLSKRETLYEPNFSYSITEGGNYTWRVKSIDHAGNESSFTTYFSFTFVNIPDISNEVVKLLSPTNKSTYSSGTIALWWEGISGANKYVLQVVKPNFTNTTQLILDTTLCVTKYEIELGEGNYEWRVKAQNDDSETSNTTRSFIINDDNFNTETVNLVSPPNYSIQNKSEVTFSWKCLPKTQYYTMQIKSNNWTTGDLYDQYFFTDTTYTINLPDGVYYWGVKATNENNFYTDYSYRKITIDTKSPNSPQLVTPADNYKTTDRTLIFNWSIENNNGETLVYQFEIYKVINGNEQQYYKTTTSLQELTYKFAETGQYNWKVVAYDNAGNFGPYSVTNTIYIYNPTDLSSTNIELLSPVDSLNTTLTKITFWWEAVDGATGYVFQLIRPNFEEPVELIKDEEITDNQIIIELSVKDSYQWRVKAKNGISETKFSIRNIVLK